LDVSDSKEADPEPLLEIPISRSTSKRAVNLDIGRGKSKIQ
jgi:hypothetical protein